MENTSNGLFCGISLNILKIIGIITMLVDHIAVYFSYKLSPEIYFVCRLIGRIAMPLFVFILVQGYLHTSNLKKYILRLGNLAIVTQVLMFILSYINNIFFANYINNLDNVFNILFSFVLSLILLKSLDFDKKFITKFNKYVNFIFRVISIICIIAIYYYINIDYKFVVPVMSINFFIFEKLKQKTQKESLKLLFTSLELIIMMMIAIIYNRMEMFTIINFLIILLYNGKKKNKFELNRIATYAFFPVHHFVLYLIAMLIGG